MFWLIYIRNISKKLLTYLSIILFIAIILSVIITVNLELTNTASIKDISDIREEIVNISNSFNETVAEITEIKEENKTYIYDPTMEDAYDFILKDKTNENKFDDSSYNCAHYSRDVNNNAENYGLRCAYVKINLQYGLPHAIIAFNTTDTGLLFFEPQTDEKVELVIGADYWADCVITNSPKVARDENNTVISHEIYW